MRPIPMPTMDDDEKPTAAEGAPSRGREVAVDACLAAAAMSGASLLAWWAVAFHPSNSRLWMVPVGLVLACTPAVVYLALTFSQSPHQPPCTVSEKESDAASEPPPPLSMVVLEK